MSINAREIAKQFYEAFITKDGEIVFPDRQLMLFAADVLSRAPGGTVIFDVKCSRNLAPWIRQHGGVPLMWMTGHSLIKLKMKKVDSPISGEMSGHIFIKERWYGFDDALYCGARLLEIVSKFPIQLRCGKCIGQRF